jgi:hypothetical protein
LSHDGKGKGGHQGKKPSLPAKKKTGPTTRDTHSASSTLATYKTSDINSDSSTCESSAEAESPPGDAPAVGHRRQHGKLHTTRVELLLTKYLQNTSDVVINGQQQIKGAEKATRVGEPAAAATVITQALSTPRIHKRPENFQKRATKSIMQVKGEQDAAVRALQHGPRQFHAKPIPLEVATPRLEKPPIITNTGMVATSTGSNIERTSINLSPRGSMSAKSVPPSTTEPRYALLVADSVLRRYSAGNQKTACEYATEDSNSTAGGLQKWLSWPAGQGEQNESAVHLQQSVAGGSPQRPQSARARRRSQSPVSTNQLPDIVEEGPEQLKEFY